MPLQRFPLTAESTITLLRQSANGRQVRVDDRQAACRQRVLVGHWLTGAAVEAGKR